MATISYDKVQDYLTSLVPPREPELQVMEEYAAKNDFPIIGPSCGYYCYQLARMIGARSVFELGSGYGYSTAWFAKAVRENGGGVIHHTVWDDKLSKMAQEHLSRLGYGDLVQYHNAEAVETLRKTQGPFDVIFNDVDKHYYPAVYPKAANRVRKGGLLLSDNVLWSGRVADASVKDEYTEGVRTFNKLLYADERYYSTILPIRDGVAVGLRVG